MQTCNCETIALAKFPIAKETLRNFPVGDERNIFYYLNYVRLYNITIIVFFSSFNDFYCFSNDKQNAKRPNIQKVVQKLIGLHEVISFCSKNVSKKF